MRNSPIPHWSANLSSSVTPLPTQWLLRLGSLTAGLVLVNTIASPAAGILGWLLADVARGKKPGVVAVASGAIAGGVAITPAAANLAPVWALRLGAVAGVLGTVSPLG